MQKNSKILVAIPIYNEEKYINTVIDKVKEYTTNILIIDDGSNDKTANLLKSHEDLAVIRHEYNMGYGRSLIDAIRYAKKNKFCWILTMDCDLQHEPETIPFFYDYIETDLHDIISGSRYLKPTSDSGVYPPESRKTINQTVTNLLKKELGLEITDSFCGFKAYRIDFIRKLQLSIDGYAFPLQVWVQAAKHGCRLAEIPVKMIYSDAMRSFGESLDNPEQRLKYYIETLNKELARNGYKNIENIKNPFQSRHNIHVA